MLRRRARGQAGFVITLELVLIFTILGLGLLVGLVAIRNALFKWWVKKQADTVWVLDSSTPAKILAPVRDFDEHETPRLFYIDRTLSSADPNAPPAGVDPTWAGHNYRAFIGVRSDRFTSRQRIFYQNNNCTGQPCIEGTGDLLPVDSRMAGEVVDEPVPGIQNLTTYRVGFNGGVGYLYALQMGPSYAIGRGLAPGAALPGTLYRQTTEVCSTDTDNTLRSVWESQRVGDLLGPCVQRTILPANIGRLWKATVVQDSNGDPVLSNFTTPFKINLPPDPAAFTSTPPTGEAP